MPADVKIVEEAIGLDQTDLTGECGLVDRHVGEFTYSVSSIGGAGHIIFDF